ncbi:hypothetical protein ACFYT4_27900 [Streptomyces sp. NPDC004609]|uniref:hypothetical protein n=1 Tax=Streptomyces sp. NPDC004609 TaxID=3364704 RepID=UPI0036A0437D
MGRSTWLTRGLGGAALLAAACAMLLFIFTPGIAVPRTDVAVSGAVALLCAAAWGVVVFRSGRRAEKPPPPSDRIPSPAAPAPPARLPMHRSGAWIRLLMVLTVVLLVQFHAELAIRPDGDDARRVSAIQKAGERLAQGTIVSKGAEPVVRAPGPDGGTVSVALPGARISSWDDVGDSIEVLYAPGSPELGGVVEYLHEPDLESLASDRWWNWSFPHSSGGIVLLLICAIAVLVLWEVATDGRLPLNAGVLRKDARSGGRLPAVRARVVQAIRTEHTTLGSSAGTTSVDTTLALRVTCENGRSVTLVRHGHLTRNLPAVARELADSPGWLMGPERWKQFKEDERPVVFVADDGRVVWGSLTVDEFKRALAGKAVQVDRERRGRPFAATATLFPAVHGSVLGLLTLAYLLTLPVLLTPSSWRMSMALSTLAFGAAAWSLVRLRRSRSAIDALPGWKVRSTRGSRLS